MKVLPSFKIKNSFLRSETKTLLILESEDKNIDSFLWLNENKAMIEKSLLEHGGVLFRNFNLYALSEFNRFVRILAPDLLDYVYRSTPRTKLGGNIYSATEYPADRTIPLHNENAYARSWPKKIFFFSVIVAEVGGETPVADSRRVYNAIDLSVRQKFEDLGVMYVRQYSKGVDLSWQEVFHTQEKLEVEKFCKENEIDFQWSEGIIELVTRQVCQASLVHPVTREPVWFNQAHLFHVSSLAENSRLSLIQEIGENNLPRNALYGNGEPIELEVLDHIRQVYEREKLKFKWQRGDIMLLDNILMTHGREPYKGERKVAVAMA